MIRWLLDKIMQWGWDFNRNLRETSAPEAIPDRTLRASPEVRISIYGADNGKILELFKRDLNSNHIVGGDDFRLMVVPEGERVSDVVAILLLAEGIK